MTIPPSFYASNSWPDLTVAHVVNPRIAESLPALERPHNDMTESTPTQVGEGSSSRSDLFSSSDEASTGSVDAPRPAFSLDSLMASWVIVPDDVPYDIRFEYPQEVATTGSLRRSVTGALRAVRSYFGWGSEILLPPRRLDSSTSLDGLKETLEQDQFLNSAMVRTWVDTQCQNSANSETFLLNFIHGASDFEQSFRDLQSTVESLLPDQTLLIPVVLKGTRLSYNHIVCLTVSTDGIDYFDPQQVPLKSSAQRELICGGSLKSLVGRIWDGLLHNPAVHQERAALSVQGNACSSPIQQDWWNCGTYVLAYMRERLAGSNHATASSSVASHTTSILRSHIWSDINVPCPVITRRHSLQGLVDRLEYRVNRQEALSLDRALEQENATQASHRLDDLDEGWDDIQIPSNPIMTDCLLEQLRSPQSVDCVGLLATAAENQSAEGIISSVSRERVLHQAAADLIRDQRVVLYDDEEPVPSTLEESAALAQNILNRIETVLERLLPAEVFQPRMTDQLLGLISQAPGAAMLAPLQTAVVDGASICPRQLPVHSANRAKVQITDREFIHSRTVAVQWVNSNEPDQVMATSALSCDFAFSFHDLLALTDGDRLDLARIQGRLTLIPVE